MMQPLIELATQMANAECDRGIRNHGTAASAHEGYALIKEEFEEAQDEIVRLEQQLGHFWTSVKADEAAVYPHYLQQIKQTAILAACECIQVAAMAEKTLGIAQTE